MRFFSRAAAAGVSVVADEAALLSSGLEPGGLAYREDVDKLYVLASGSAGTLSNWSEVVQADSSTGLVDAVALPPQGLNSFLLAGM